MAVQDFEWEHDRYNQTRERHDGIPCGIIDTGIAYGLMVFSGLAGMAACGVVGITLLQLLR